MVCVFAITLAGGKEENCVLFSLHSSGSVNTCVGEYEFSKFEL